MAKHGEYPFKLALFRLAKVLGNDAASGDYGRAWRAFRHTGGFCKLMLPSQRDLAQALDNEVSAIATALAVIMHHDIEAGEAATLGCEGVGWRGSGPHHAPIRACGIKPDEKSAP